MPSRQRPLYVVVEYFLIIVKGLLCGSPLEGPEAPEQIIYESTKYNSIRDRLRERALIEGVIWLPSAPRCRFPLEGPETPEQILYVSTNYNSIRDLLQERELIEEMA